jgi:hypothetical protein
MTDKLTYEVSRSLIEHNYDIVFTDEQWQEVSDTLYNALDSYTWLDLPSIIKDLD